MRTHRAALTAAVLATLAAARVAPAEPAIDAAGVELVAGIDIPESTHIEFMDREVDLDGNGTAETRTFVLAGSRDSLLGGLRIIDVTEPSEPSVVSYVPCKQNANDVAAVEANGRWYVSLARSGSSPACTVTAPDGAVLRGNAIFVVDATDPANPIPLGWPAGLARFDKGGHTIVAHPTQPILYIASQELPDRRPSIEIVDFSKFPAPEAAKSVQITTPTGVSPHDITFNPAGTRAYASSIDATYILDTTDPWNPNPIPLAAIVDPEIKIHHEAVLHPNGRHLLIVDEFVAAPPAGTPACPGGGVIVYDLGPGGMWERAPVKVGSFYANDTSAPVLADTHATPLDPACTAHEFNVSADGTFMPIGWMGAGVRVFDLTALVDAAALPVPTPVIVPEIGHWKFPETDMWAAKIHPAQGTTIFASDTAATPAAEGSMPGGLRVLTLTGG